MGGGLESRCLGRVCGADVAVRLASLYHPMTPRRQQHVSDICCLSSLALPATRFILKYSVKFGSQLFFKIPEAFILIMFISDIYQS